MRLTWFSRFDDRRHFKENQVKTRPFIQGRERTSMKRTDTNREIYPLTLQREFNWRSSRVINCIAARERPSIAFALASLSNICLTTVLTTRSAPPALTSSSTREYLLSVSLFRLYLSTRISTPRRARKTSFAFRSFLLESPRDGSSVIRADRPYLPRIEVSATRHGLSSIPAV